MLIQREPPVQAASVEQLRGVRVIMRGLFRVSELVMQGEILFQLLLQWEMPNLRSGLLIVTGEWVLQTKILSQL